jgi:two-component system, chemotaxis family, sensor kinase CheA
MSNSSDADLLNIFWSEVGDYLASLNGALLKVETASAQDNRALLREMNRFAHSMKGAAHAVGINVIETIAHYMEEIFDAAVNGRLQLTPDKCDLLYDGLDLIQNVVNGIENSTETLAGVLARLEQTVVSLTPEKREPREAAELPPSPPTPQVAQPDVKRTTSNPAVMNTIEMGDTGTLQLRPAEDSIRVSVGKLDRLMGEVSELLITRMHSEERQRELEKLHRYNHRWQREWRAVRTAYIRLVRHLQNKDDEMADELSALFRFLESNQRYLIDSNRHLAQLTQGMMQFNSQLGMLAEQLQDDIGGMRLVPFESVLAGFQRMVRDMARDTGKNINLDVSGANVEIDRAALDALKEPIMHLMRNAVDHGLESTAERERAGKTPSGHIGLHVEQRGKEIIVRLSDDGRGLDPAKIGRAAHEMGLLTAQEAAALTEDEAYNLIFHPGFSTSQQVTSLSGRGMGMDIIRTRVEHLRGRVGVQSAIGKGTTFSLRIPVSLTRISCIMLRIGEQEFAVPSIAVSRMLNLGRDQVFTAEGREMVMIGGQPMPLIPLHNLLEIPGSEAKNRDEVTLLVLSVGERAVAFEVDELYSEQELVLKPLGVEIQNVPHVSGAALLGTGDVIIVLDPNDLIRNASGVRRLPRVVVREPKTETVEPKRLRILIADDSITTRTLEKHILETAGFEVHVAIDGLEAWEKIGETEFDLLIADVEMPNMTGLELAVQVKGTETTKHLPMILLTSLGKPEQREAGLKSGADAYLVKSRFDQAELLRTIRALV